MAWHAYIAQTPTGLSSYRALKTTVALFCLCSMPIPVLAVFPLQGACAERQQNLITIFRTAASKVRVRLSEVEASAILSPETKKGFTQDAEWLNAWLQDQSERLEEGSEECDALPALRLDAIAQILPVERASRKISATTLVWQLDRLSQSVREENDTNTLDALRILGEARTIFHRISENAGSAEPVRPLLRRGAFLIRQGLRILRIHGILS